MAKKVTNTAQGNWSVHLRMLKKNNYKPGTYDYLEALTGGITSEWVLGKIGITMAEFRTLILYQAGFSFGRKEVPCLFPTLKNFFEEHGFIVKIDGSAERVGWLISCRED